MIDVDAVRQHRDIELYLIGFVEEGFDAVRDTPNQTERIAENVETENDHVDLLQELSFVMIGDLFRQSLHCESIFLSFVVIQSEWTCEDRSLSSSSSLASLENHILNFGNVQNLKKKIDQRIFSEQLIIAFRSVHGETDMDLANKS